MEIQGAKGVVGAALVLALGCGRTTSELETGTGGAGVPASQARQDGGAGGLAGSSGGAPCRALALEPDAPLLVTGIGPELWLVRADGSRTALDHGFGAALGPDTPVEVRWLQVEGGRVLVAAQVGELSTYRQADELALFASDGQKLWQHATPAPSERTVSNPLLDARGYVAFLEYDGVLGETGIVVAPDGRKYTFPGSAPRSTPDERGFIVVARGDVYGFQRLGEPAFVAARFLPHPEGTPPPSFVRLFESSLLYVANTGPTGWSVVFENADEARLFELPSFAEPSMNAIPFGVHVSDRWALVTHGGLPVLRLDLRAKAAFPVDASGIDLGTHYPLVTSQADRFLAQNDAEILWRIDGASGRLLPIDFSATLLHALESSYCTPPIELEPDGRVALALRSGAVGGIFLEPRNGESWTRLGLPLFGHAFVGVGRRGQAWLIHADDGSNTYCARPNWPDAGAAPAGALIGSSLQIALPERGIARALPVETPRLAATHASGLCLAFHADRELILYDPVSGDSTSVLSTEAELTWSTASAFF